MNIITKSKNFYIKTIITAMALALAGLFVLSPTIQAAHSGGHPGGVDTDLVLWLKADFGTDMVATGSTVTQWDDANGSGVNPSNATNGPIFNDGVSAQAINFNPVTSYIQAQNLVAADEVLGITDKSEIFTVRRDATAQTTQNYQHFRLGEDDAGLAGISLYAQANPVEAGTREKYIFNGVGSFVNALHAVSALDTVQITSFSNDSSTMVISKNGLQLDEDTTVSATLDPASDVLVGGAVGDVGFGGFAGDIAEIIVYNVDKGLATDRQQIQSYLALKYGITLDVGVVDYVDSVGSSVYSLATYEHDVFGIAHDSVSSLDQQISKSVNTGAIVTLSTDTNFVAANGTHTSLTDGQYLIIGNDGGVTTTQMTELPAGATDRITREWRVENTGSVGAINLKFDGFDDDWSVYIDADGDFVDAVAEGTLDVNGEIEVTLEDGEYFTLAQQAPVIAIEFESAAADDDENIGGNLPNLLIDGMLLVDTDIDLLVGASGTATAGVDYVLGGITGPLPQTITMTIPAGTYTSATPVPLNSLAATLDFAITGDTGAETDETINLTLTNAQPSLAIDEIVGGALIASHVYTITNDDIIPPSTSSGGSSRSGLSTRYYCHDVAANNYRDKGKHKQSKCEYDESCHDSEAINYSSVGIHVEAVCEYEETEEPTETVVPVSNPVASASEDSNETICSPYMTGYIKLGSSQNDQSEVNKLISFLNEKQGENLLLDGSYDRNDFEAVKRFQLRYSDSVLSIWGIKKPTGYVYKTTLLKINSFYCNQNLQCPAFVEYNSLPKGENVVSAEVKRTKQLLSELGFYSGPINQVFDASLHSSIITFQETFRETMLDPWGIRKGTGYKYKTTNKFLNFLVGCETGVVELDGQGSVDY